MKVNFGFVAMSMQVKNASPSKTITLKSFNKIADRQAALKKVYRIASENLENTKRVLYHAIANDISFYRFSSRLIPLNGHEAVKEVNYIKMLQKQFAEIGKIVKEHKMRVGFHPDHFTNLSSPRKDVIRYSIGDLVRHVRMLHSMGLDQAYKCNIHVGGSYGDKRRASARFVENFYRLDEKIRVHMVLENDDKTFTAKETLEIAKECNVPMVLDLHHHRCNNQGESEEEIFAEAVKTWKNERFPPKIHLSSPKNSQEFRSHADYVRVEDIYPFLQVAKKYTDQLDIMIEAKQKDAALFDLMDDLKKQRGIQLLSKATILVE